MISTRKNMTINREQTAATIQTEEEHDNLARSTKKIKMVEGDTNNPSFESHNEHDKFSDCRRKSSYKEKVMGSTLDTEMGDVEGDEVEDNVCDDDEVQEDDTGPWFSMGTIKQEKIDARWPWKMSLIIKLVGRSVGYHFLHNHLQALWKC